MFDESDGYGSWMGGPWGSAPAAGWALTQQEDAFLRLPPDLFFASGLFQAQYLRRRRAVRDLLVHSTGAARQLRYSGEQLDQFDLDVYLACARQAPRQPGSRPCAVTMDICAVGRSLMRSAAEPARERVLGSLLRLEAARIRITDGRFAYTLRPVQKVLHDSRECRCLVELNKEMLLSLHTIPNLESFVSERSRLGRKAMDRWLHAALHFSPQVCILLSGLPAISGNASAGQDLVGRSLERMGPMLRPGEASLRQERGIEIHRAMAAGRQ